MKELGLIFFALALVAEAVGLWLWWRMKRKSQKGVTAQATVLERITLGSGERDTVLIVEYQKGGPYGSSLQAFRGSYHYLRGGFCHVRSHGLRLGRLSVELSPRDVYLLVRVCDGAGRSQGMRGAEKP